MQGLAEAVRSGGVNPPALVQPNEKAAALKAQYAAIKHQGARGDNEEAGKTAYKSPVAFTIARAK